MKIVCVVNSVYSSIPIFFSTFFFIFFDSGNNFDIRFHATFGHVWTTHSTARTHMLSKLVFFLIPMLGSEFSEEWVQFSDQFAKFSTSLADIKNLGTVGGWYWPEAMSLSANISTLERLVCTTQISPFAPHHQMQSGKMCVRHRRRHKPFPKYARTNQRNKARVKQKQKKWRIFECEKLSPWKIIYVLQLNEWKQASVGKTRQSMCVLFANTFRNKKKHATHKRKQQPTLVIKCFNQVPFYVSIAARCMCDAAMLAVPTDSTYPHFEGN